MFRRSWEPVAQSVEQLTFNQRVTGSIPVGLTKPSHLQYIRQDYARRWSALMRCVRQSYDTPPPYLRAFAYHVFC